MKDQVTWATPHIVEANPQVVEENPKGWSDYREFLSAWREELFALEAQSWAPSNPEGMNEHTAVIFVNGIFPDVATIKQNLQDLANKANTEVWFHFNDTVPDLASIENVPNDAPNSPADKCATRLVKKIRERLNDTVQKVVMVSHSHGACIGALALKKVTKTEKSQIRVVTLGGAIAVAGDQEHVANLVHVQDPISRIARSIMDSNANSYVQKISMSYACEREWFCAHSAKEYLSNGEVREKIEKFVDSQITVHDQVCPAGEEQEPEHVCWVGEEQEPEHSEPNMSLAEGSQSPESEQGSRRECHIT